MISILSCYIADLIFGDPEWFPHPVRIIGGLIHSMETLLRGRSTDWIERLKGAVLAIVVIGITASCVYGIILISVKVHPLLGSLVWIYIGYTTISVKDLRVKVRGIQKEIKKNDLSEGRRQLSKIVGRDTDDLSKEKIIVATLESIAENTNDGIVAPLFYLIVGGPTCAMVYKAINTMDSMIGYKDDRYRHFGWFPAKLDDVANFIPARISGILICLSAGIMKKRFTKSFMTMLKDSRKHSSPNSGVSEAAMAGALGVRFGGHWQVNGRPSLRPYIGQEEYRIRPSLINNALTVSLNASFMMVILGIMLRWLI